MAIPSFNTERLVLRPLQHGDLDDLYEYAQDPEVYRTGLWQPYESIETCRKDLDNLMASYYDGLMWWAIEHKADRKMIGRIQISNVNRDDKQAEISYALNRAYWRQGIMTEASNRIIDYAFNTMQLNRLYANTLTENEKSIKLLEKLRFKREGHLRDYTWVKGYAEDVYVYGLLKSDLTTP